MENKKISNLKLNSILLLSTMIAIVSSHTANICQNFKLYGKCQCHKYKESVNEIRLECSQTTARKLIYDIDLLKKSGKVIIEMQVSNSNLRDLNNLPIGLHGIHELIFDNTRIDLETVKKSNEMLKLLKKFRVYNENFTEIPGEFFLGMDELKVLALNYIGIAYISEDTFSNLEDSLNELELRENKLRSFPIAIKSLSQLESLDLYGNEIKTVPDDNKAYLNLNRLKRLTLNRINCTCGFGNTDFATWIRSHAIKGVICDSPNRLIGRDVWTTPIEEFCETSSHIKHYSNLTLITTLLSLFLLKNL